MTADHTVVHTSDLRPGDVVATLPAPHIGARDVDPSPVGWIDSPLTHRVQWRTVNAVVPVNLSATRVEFTDGCHKRGAWNDSTWARRTPPAEVYGGHSDGAGGDDR